MLRLRQELRIFHNLDLSFLFWTQVECVLLISLLSLPQCCYIMGMPCHRSRSSCQFSIPKSNLVFVGGTQSPTPDSIYRSPIFSFYPTVVCIRWLLDLLIPTFLNKPLQESSVLGCACLDIHCLLVWSTKLPGDLPFQNVGCTFCNYSSLSALSLLFMILSSAFAPALS